MNAYELANELQKHGLNGDNHGLFNKRIQNMLRQQADELKACKIHDRRGWEYAEELEQERRKQADRIAELEKDLHMTERHYERLCTEQNKPEKFWSNTPSFADQFKQSEPVAWTDGKFNLSFDKTGICDIPLYTTPQTKPLSFDVMVELGKEVDAVWDVNINGSVWFPSVDAFESFCRAIEERHGIK